MKKMKKMEKMSSRKESLKMELTLPQVPVPFETREYQSQVKHLLKIPSSSTASHI